MTPNCLNKMSLSAGLVHPAILLALTHSRLPQVTGRLDILTSLFNYSLFQGLFPNILVAVYVAMVSLLSESLVTMWPFFLLALPWQFMIGRLK